MKLAKCFLSILLVVALLIGMMPMVFAEDIDYTGNNTNVTENYIDTDGITIADSTKTVGEDITAPVIDGYVYSSYTADISYVYYADDYHHRYINGYPDGTVRAEGNITRAEAVQMLYNLFGTYFTTYVKSVYDGDLAALALNTEDLSDVQSGGWYYNAVKTLYNMGLVSGYDDSTFKPDEPITRAEYAILVSLVDQLDEDGESVFSDIEGHWAAGLINAAAKKGWINGYEDGTFKPDEPITRAEAVTLANAIMKRVTNATSEEFDNPYSDIDESHWAYIAIMEASDTHEARSWHDSGKEGITGLNMTTERFVDQDGNEIADTATSSGDDLIVQEIDGYSYGGYLKVITYTYEVEVEVEVLPNPAITKSASVKEAEPGEEFSYEITASNGEDAEVTWTNVIATDNLPLEVTYIDAESEDGVTVENNDGKLTISFGDIEPGESKTVVIYVCMNNNGTINDTFKNTVTASGDNTTEDVTAEDDGVKIIGAMPEPAITKSASVKEAEPGEEFSYEITASNGEVAEGTWINAIATDNLPWEVTYIDAESEDGVTVENNSGELTISFGDIEPGESKTVVIHVRMNHNGTIYNTFKNTVTASGDTTTEDVTAEDDGVKIIGDPGPYGSKVASVETAEVEDEITYTITLGNDGTRTWDTVWVNDVLPDTVEYVSHKTTNWVTLARDGQALSMRFGNIKVGEEKTITITVRILDTAVVGEIIKNAITVSPGDSNGNDLEITDEGIRVYGDPNPVIEKKASVKTAEIGDEYTYAITASNDGEYVRDWTDVIVTDELPASVSYVGYGSNYGVTIEDADGVLSIDFGTIEAGETKTVSITVTVNTTATVGEMVYNTVTTSGGSSGSSTESFDEKATDDGVRIYGDPNPVVEKKASVKTAEIGDEYTYTITAPNSGEYLRTWTDVTATDKLPEGITYVGYGSNYGAKVSADGQTLSISFGDIACGESKSVTITVKVNSNASVGDLIKNTVTASGGSDGSSTEDFNEEATDEGVRIYGAPNPVVEKNASATTAEIGDEYIYTITAANTGDYLRTWTNAVGTDTLPAGITYVSSSSKDGVSVKADGQKLTVNFGDIACNISKTVTITVRVAASATVGNTLYNRVTVTGGTDGSTGTDYNGNATDEGVTIYGNPNPSVSKKSSVNNIDVGSTFSYTITAANTGDYLRTWTNAVGTDTLPDGMIYVSSSTTDGVTVTAVGQKLTINFGDITCGKSKSVVIKVKVTTSVSIGTLLKNTVLVTGGSSGSSEDSFTATDTDETVRVYGDPNTSVSKKASVTNATVGDTYSYTITATNSGEYIRTWTNAVGTDTLPAGITYVSSSSNDGVTVTANGQTLRINFGDINARGSKTVTITVKVASSATVGATLYNSVTVKGDNGEATGKDTGVKINSAEPNPSITKAASAKTANAGSQYTYTIKVSNSSSATGTWTNVMLTDELDQYLTFVSDSVKVDGNSATASYANRTITLSLGDIAPGVTKTVTFDVIVRSDGAGTRIYNTALAAGGNGSVSATDTGMFVTEDGTKPSDILPIVMHGRTDGTFGATDTLRRSEAITMLYRVLSISTGGKYTVTNTATNAFSDVPVGSYYYEAVDYMLTSGVISASTGTFRPDDPVLRSEYCAMYARALNLTYSGSYSGTFTDLTSSHWAYSYVLAVLEKGWIDANGSTFNPEGYILRQDAARLVCNAQSKRMEVFASAPKSQYPVYSDISSSHGYYNHIMAVGMSADYVYTYSAGMFEYAD